ncbi:MAG: SAM-dependent methyltransferase, partial [Gammaproteobacteria bacterium]|nr:SAM-dependent methyltransferase [Gammaproteobacteria bacterium]
MPKNLFRLVFLLGCTFTLTAATVAVVHAQTARSTDGIYEQRDTTRNGTGKIYLGREISYVMGHQGAGWLERPDR